MKKTIAQKKVSQKHTARWVLPAAACTPLAALFYIFKYRLAGYSFSALVCLSLIALILFYTVMEYLRVPFPRFSWWATHAVTLLLAVGLSVCAVTEGLIIKASFGASEAEIAQCDYVLVLGAKVREWGPSVSLWDRIDGAAAFLGSRPHPIAVVTGGQGPDEVETEAGCMYRVLTEQAGIDPDRIWIEDKATSTWENIKYSLDLIEEKTGVRPTKIGVISSEYHLFRASLFAKEQGVEFVGIPARTSRIPQMVNHFMREVAGVWHYLLLGGRYE